MQGRQWGNKVFRVMGVVTLVASLTLFACSSDDDTQQLAAGPLSNQVVQMTPTTAGILVNPSTPLTLNNGAFLDPRFGSNASMLTFTDPNNISLATANGSASGPVTFGSCTFSYNKTTFGAAQGPQTGEKTPFPGCIIKISSTVGIPIGGFITGTAVLSLTDTKGNTADFPAINVTLSVNADGFLVINGIVTPVKPAAPTGTTGTGGTP